MNNLPHSIVIKLDDLNFHPFDDDLEELVSDYLSNNYGFYHYGFDYRTDIVSGTVHITDIFWVLEE